MGVEPKIVSFFIGIKWKLTSLNGNRTDCTSYNGNTTEIHLGHQRLKNGEEISLKTMGILMGDHVGLYQLARKLTVAA